MKNLLKNCIFYTISLLFSLHSIAQVTNEGTPKSWTLSNLKSSTPVIMPSFDVEAMRAEDALAGKGQAFRFGKEMEVNIGISNSGTWEDLENGDRIWRVNIVSSGAKTISFIFNQYKMPSGASVYLYSDDRQSLLGAYTDVMNLKEETLGTWWVDSDNVWVEYYEPSEVQGQGKLNIGTVVHGYRSVTEKEIMQKALNDSGSCNLDVDCGVGSDYDGLKDLLKHSVALISQGGFVCSGTMLNNTSLDETPYFLFANHCNFNPATSSFRFNWISPSPVCASTANSPNGSFNTTSGATLLSTNSQSDYRLFRIEGGINADWEIEYAGWDTSDDQPDFVVGIHHPAGDIMKICRNDTGTSQVTSGGQIFWRIDSGSGQGWEQGVTEGGSSGSGIFDQEGRLIGTLCCGAAACAGTNDNNQLDLYGRFATSYNNNNLAQWLDPEGTGATSILTLTEELLLSTEDFIVSSFEVYPNPSTTGIINISTNNTTILDYAVFNIIGQQIEAGSFNSTVKQVDLSQFSSGVYFIKISSGDRNITKKVIIK